jgi:hypothetical protein
MVCEKRSPTGLLLVDYKKTFIPSSAPYCVR